MCQKMQESQKIIKKGWIRKVEIEELNNNANVVRICEV